MVRVGSKVLKNTLFSGLTFLCGVMPTSSLSSTLYEVRNPFPTTETTGRSSRDHRVIEPMLNHSVIHFMNWKLIKNKNGRNSLNFLGKKNGNASWESYLIGSSAPLLLGYCPINIKFYHGTCMVHSVICKSECLAWNFVCLSNTQRAR